MGLVKTGKTFSTLTARPAQATVGIQSTPQGVVWLTNGAWAIRRASVIHAAPLKAALARPIAEYGDFDAACEQVLKGTSGMNKNILTVIDNSIQEPDHRGFEDNTGIKDKRRFVTLTDNKALKVSVDADMLKVLLSALGKRSPVTLLQPIDKPTAPILIERLGEIVAMIMPSTKLTKAALQRHKRTMRAIQSA